MHSRDLQNYKQQRKASDEQHKRKCDVQQRRESKNHEKRAGSDADPAAGTAEMLSGGVRKGCAVHVL